MGTNDKLIKTCQRILKLEDFKITMNTFTNLPEDKGVILMDVVNSNGKVKHPCGTSYCLAGMLAAQDNYPEKYRRSYASGGFDFFAYIEDSLGCNDPSDKWYEFLFSMDWPNSLEAGKLRAQYLIDHNYEIQHTDDQLVELGIFYRWQGFTEDTEVSDE